MIEHPDLPDGWLARIQQLMVDDAVDAIESPWIVVCTDLHSGVSTCTGPYPDGLSALRAADWERREQEKLDPPDAFDFSVARLGAPTTLGAVAEPAPLPPGEPGTSGR